MSVSVSSDRHVVVTLVMYYTPIRRCKIGVHALQLAAAVTWNLAAVGPVASHIVAVFLSFLDAQAEVMVG